MAENFDSYLNNILEAFDSIDIENEYRKRVCVKPLYDYFQILTYACIPVVLGGLLAILTAIRPSRAIGLLSGLLMILPALFLTLLSPLYGGPIIIAGIITVIMSRRATKKSRV